MNIFKKPKKTEDVYAMQTSRQNNRFAYTSGILEYKLYEQLRITVPVIDACINKIIRLSGNFKLFTSDECYQDILDSFVNNVKVGISSTSLYSFVDSYLDSLLTYGNAIGEMLINANTGQLAGLYNADPTIITVRAGDTIINRQYYVYDNGKAIKIPHPERILYTALNPNSHNECGVSMLRGLPFISNILTRIYDCIGQNFDRIGNVRYAVTYKPSNEFSDIDCAKENAMLIAKEWADGMSASDNGEIKDFIAVGDINIKVIGAENQIINTEIPVRQMLEQIVAKLGIPPFLLGLNWSTSERMSKQQADILTSELEFYRRLLTPVILKIADTFLLLSGIDTKVNLKWETINLQDECETALARLRNAQALKIESSLT